MNPLSQMFNKGPSLISYLVLGDPDQFLEAAQCAFRAGVDGFEIGLPVGDPVADGPIIREASERALGHRLDFKDECAVLAQLRRDLPCPIGVMTYAHRLQAKGAENFVRALEESGVDSLLVADLCHDADEEMSQVIAHSNLDRIGMVIPGIRPQRVIDIADHSSGYLYGVHFKGVTGARADTREDLESQVTTWKQGHDLPVVVGFGLSNAKQVRAVFDAGADGAVVGSAGVKLLGPNGGLDRFEEFYCELSEARSVSGV